MKKDAPIAMNGRSSTNNFGKHPPLVKMPVPIFFPWLFDREPPFFLVAPSFLDFPPPCDFEVDFFFEPWEAGFLGIVSPFPYHPSCIAGSLPGIICQARCVALLKPENYHGSNSNERQDHEEQLREAPALETVNERCKNPREAPALGLIT
jgi:hypothetical protein